MKSIIGIFGYIAHDISAMEQDIERLYTSSKSTPFRTPWIKFETYNPIDVGEDRFSVTTGVLQQFWDMSADKI